LAEGKAALKEQTHDQAENQLGRRASCLSGKVIWDL
jgi:hypothetical protein